MAKGCITYQTLMQDKGGTLQMPVTLCFCFGYTDEAIRRDVLEHGGHSTILERIKGEKARGACQCATKNPRGR